MPPRFSLSDYIDQALAQAVYEKLGSRSVSGKIPLCEGVVAFAASPRECKDELRAVLENWILRKLKTGQALPILSGIDLNNIPPLASKNLPGIKGRNTLSGREIQHRLVDARVTQKRIVKYLQSRGWKNLDESKVSRILNERRQMPANLEAALLQAIDKLRRR
jgi:hypothetical protein